MRRSMELMAGAVLAGSLAAAAMAPMPQAIAAPVTILPWSVPDIGKLPDDAEGRLIRQGRDILNHTYAVIGPEVANPAMRFAGNNLACSNCHLGAGTQEYALPLVGVSVDFPEYRARRGGAITLQERVNSCMTRSMNGRALPVRSETMKAIIAYLKFLSKGMPLGTQVVGHGAGNMPELDRAADPERGKKVYAANCAACHGADGAGQRNGVAGDAKGYAVPPLWGPDSFNDAAGTERLITAANFIHDNMPAGTTFAAPALSPEDAWDVAAYMESQPRPQKSDLAKDFPDRLQKPVDTPYGPYADGFSEKQHKYGPFAPIRARIRELKMKGAQKRGKSAAE